MIFVRWFDDKKNLYLQGGGEVCKEIFGEKNVDFRYYYAFEYDDVQYQKKAFISMSNESQELDVATTKETGACHIIFPEQNITLTDEMIYIILIDCHWQGRNGEAKRMDSMESMKIICDGILSSIYGKKNSCVKIFFALYTTVYTTDKLSRIIDDLNEDIKIPDGCVVKWKIFQLREFTELTLRNSIRDMFLKLKGLIENGK